MKFNIKKYGCVIIVAVVLLQASSAFASISANYSNGSVIVGAAVDACVAGLKGSMRWNNTSSAIEVCNGSAWQGLINSGSGPNPTYTGDGYFVLSSGVWNGDLKTVGGGTDGLLGANALCLSDLTANDWMGKTDATTRGLLDSVHVGAFICASGGSALYCNYPYPATKYSFAVSGDNTKGGAYFVTTGSGLGPGDTNQWTGTNYFNGIKEYWTSIVALNQLYWNLNGTGANCTNYTSSSSAVTGVTGNSSSYFGARYHSSVYNCNLTKHLICIVHP